MHSLGPRRTLAIAALGAVIALSTSGLANAQAPAAYGIATTRNVPIRMSDGTVLRANLYRPTDLKTGKLAPGPFPVILSQTPYGKVDNEVPGGRTNQLTGYEPKFVEHGYIAAVVDVRGTGASSGQFQLLGPQEARDSVEVIRWASRLEHSTGKVGTYGPSYLGIDQFMAAARVGRNSPLKAMFPIIAANDPYRDLAVSGGLLNIESLVGLGAAILALHTVGPAIGETTNPVQVVLDTAEHTATLTSFLLPDFADFISDGPRAFDGEYWRSRSPDTTLKKVVANRIPVYLVGGLYDVFQSGEPLNFAGLQNAWAGRRPSAPMSAHQKVTGRYQLMMGPWYHTNVVQAAFQPTAQAWFDHWLKGKQNGIANTKKPLHLLDPDGKRRDAARYPLERSQPATYYLGAKTLTTTPPAGGGADQISYSPISQPCNRATEQWALGVPALALGLLGAMDACAESNLVPPEFSPALTYTSPPLSEAKLIGGPITATIYATANTTETAWVASLNDVAPDGSSRQLTAGGLLGSQRALDPVRTWKTTGGRTLFAYHPLTESSQQAVVPGKLTRYDIEIRPTFIRVPAGHRLRLDIATGDSPHIVPNLVQLPKLLGGSYTIERSKNAPSSLQLLLAPSARLRSALHTSVTGSQRMGQFLRAAVAALVISALAPAVASAQVPVYGTNDAGGFRNIMPAGAHGVDNVLQLGAFLTLGLKPPHYDDQQSMYDGLVNASPNLTHDQIASYYKDATFGVQGGDVESYQSPRPGVTIIRDKQFGVPHIYGLTHADVMFGTGYAGAEDRLFLMDVLRNTGRATLSSFAGGSASNRSMDAAQWALAPYTEADLQWQIDNATKQYGKDGQGVVDDVNEYVAGINAYIDAAMLNPLLMPAEYATISVLAPRKWTATDVIAIASLVGGIFGRGGGSELQSALALQALQRRYGKRGGERAWSDFRSKDDPESPTTVPGRFPYETTSPFSLRGLAMPDAGTVKFTPTAPPPPAASRQAKGWVADLGKQLVTMLRSAVPHASNSLLIAGRHSATGHPIAVMGPQVGYYNPQVLVEEDLHGPGVDARGAAFPGVNMYVQLGHGRDYAWSATSADADNIDTFAEVLCKDDFHYMYKGNCLAMEKLTRTNSWQPTVQNMTPAGSETLTAYRTVHGIVFARATIKGKKVAYVSARTTYFHEADSALGFKQFNDPGYVTNARRFQKAASNINFVFNWLYTDSDDIAYYLSGWYPQRSPRTSTDLPILGTGAYDWKGYKASNHTETVLPYSKHPNVINPDYLVSWNNKQAKGFSASDSNWSWGPIFRSSMLEDFMKRGIAKGRKMALNELVSAMDEPATQDIRGLKLIRILSRALGDVSADPKLGPAITLLKKWSASGAHRRDLNGDGVYDDDAAVTLMDAWWPKLVDAEFKGALTEAPMKAIQRLNGIGDHTSGGPNAPDFAGGWWGYVSKDLRTLFGPRPARAARYSRVYCGRGSRAACRSALRQSLLAALGVGKQALYGRGACAGNAQASCFDRNAYTTASGISLPPFVFQNRPTFQQTVELTKRLPR